LSIRIKFMGGVRTVTGSSHLVTNGNSKFIIDCGLFQGHRKEFYQRNSKFLFDPTEIQACVLSHAHIDHSGNIPNLTRNGFTGRIISTEATTDLCSAMLPDSGHIQEENIEYLNKINTRKGLPPKEPLYTRKDAEDSLKFFSGYSYHEKIEISENATVTLYDAGHVLGSSLPYIELKDGPGTVKIAYTLDLGRKNLPILRDPEIPPEIDYMFLESTYGGRLHAPATETMDKLAEIVNSTIEKGGKIIIPSFALERTQEVVYYLSQLFNNDVIPEIPVYVDSPLAVNITGVFERHPECYDEEMREIIRNDGDPFGTERISYITDVEDSKNLNKDDNPMIIISAAGMCEAGRILHHLRNNIGDSKNTILIVGYMARNTLGRRLVERQKVVKIFGERHELKARVEKINAFSAHADRDEILEYVSSLKGKIKKIFIVHGEMDQSEKLAGSLTSSGFDVLVPTPGEEYEVKQ
jgi:metallo-beta-lactamase family protein